MTPEAVLAWKLRLFGAGALFLVLGIALDRPPLVLASIVVLAAAVLLRIVSRRPPPPRHPSWDEPDDPAP